MNILSYEVSTQRGQGQAEAGRAVRTSHPADGDPSPSRNPRVTNLM